MKKSTSSDSFVVLAGLAQKINAPLKSISLSSQKLLDTYKNKDFEYISYKDFRHILVTLEQMNKEITRCCQTTQRLLNLDKSDIKTDSSNINEAIQDVVKLLHQHTSLCKIKLNVRLKTDLFKVALSKVDVYQIVHNVLTNAIQSMPSGGALKIRSFFEKKSNFIILEVFDEGVGISPEHLSKVFEPFFTTSKQGAEKSSGLGLSIVYSIIHSAGGLINIQSSLRKGTHVRISLPVAHHD